METADVLADAYERIRGAVHRVTDALPAEALTYRPDPDANSIAWLVWHATRIQDDHVAHLAGTDQVWTTQGHAQQLALPFEETDTGFGHTSDQVAAVRPDDARVLVDYHDAVQDATRAYLATVDAEELDRIVDESYDPPVSAGVRLVSVISDNIQHLGQALYVRGIWERTHG